MEHSGKPITLSAEWGVKGLGGLKVMKMRPPELKRHAKDVPPPAWKVVLRRWGYELDESGNSVPVTLQTCLRSEQIAVALAAKRFTTRRDALEAVSVELWRLSQ